MKPIYTITLVVGCMALVTAIYLHQSTPNSKVSVSSNTAYKKLMDNTAQTEKENIQFSDSRQAEKSTIESEKLAEVEYQLQLLRDQVAAMKSTNTIESESSQVENNPKQPAPTKEQIVVEELKQFQQVDNTFASQDLDASWSNSAMDTIDAALYKEDTEMLNVKNVECRTSLCRLELGDMNDKQLTYFQVEFRDKVINTFSAGMARKNAEGNLVVFLAKDQNAFGLTPRSDPQEN